MTEISFPRARTLTVNRLKIRCTVLEQSPQKSQYEIAATMGLSPGRVRV
ncbi:hypothetical protein ACE3NQ_17635 [Paenibacillus terreus]|uniref:Uncharacterized protein n=1 Tax=Paenibacillus terreus TaxID=1387834 RepID=A0ABV5BAL5_9BACL